MPWSTTRQLLFAIGVVAIIAAISAGLYFFFVYTPPSCSDGIHNQNEEGVDCGGVCLALCTQPNISALWARSVRVAPGVYHAVALVKNPNTSAQGIIPYKVSLFDEENILIATREGALALLPGDVAPLFEANVITGERIPARTFVDMGIGTFERAERETSPVRVFSFNMDAAASRVTALIENQSVFPVDDITITALLFSSTELLINASQTRIEKLGAKERREIIFTWQEPFSETPVRVDILPRLRIH